MAFKIYKGKKRRKKEKQIKPLSSESDFSAIEAYKTIRTNLLFTTQNKDCNRVVLTSTLPGEGKTTSITNLGITLAQTDKKILIIDCDLRNPTVHKILDIKGLPGLSEILAGMNEFDEVIQHSIYPNLDVLCAGTIPPNPAELLGSSNMDDLLDMIDKEYSFILMDTPPVNVVSDALVLSAKSDGVILVVKQYETTHPELARTLSSLEFSNAKVLGIILKGIENGGKYGYGKYKYGYKRYGGYADHYKNTAKK